jgi:hypothetical protein
MIEPEISLNAITGTPTPKTMRLIGALLGVMPKNEEEIRVKVASGQEIVS